MKVSILKEDLLPKLQSVVSIAGSSQDVLNNLLLTLGEDRLTITGTDNEVELVASIKLKSKETGQITVPAKKFFGIVKGLAAGSNLTLTEKDDKCIVTSGKRRFTLATLPPADFPVNEPMKGHVTAKLTERVLSESMRSVSFAMADKDVRYFLNGMLLQVDDGKITCVATDGHRLAKFCDDVDCKDDIGVIIPRKAVAEIIRLIGDSDDEIELNLTSNRLRLSVGDIDLTTKLIDGRYPDFEKVIPIESDNIAMIDLDNLKNAISSIALLAHEDHKGVRLSFGKNTLQAETSNPRHEDAQDEIDIEYTGAKVEIGFNLVYLLDALSAIDTDDVELIIGDSNTTSIIIHPDGDKRSLYVVMPMRL